MAFINLSDRSLYLDECVLIALILGAYAVWLLVAWLRRSRPDLGIGRAVAVAFLLRLIAAAALGSLSIGSQLRGGDEDTFLGASARARQPFDYELRIARRADQRAAHVPVLAELPHLQSRSAVADAAGRDDHVLRHRAHAARRGRVRARRTAGGADRCLDPRDRAGQHLLLQPAAQGAADVHGRGRRRLRRSGVLDARQALGASCRSCSGA